MTRWLLSSPAGMFYCLAASGLYEVAGAPAGWPALAVLLSSYLLHSIIAVRITGHALQRGRRLPHDFDSFIFFTWPVSAPIYLVRTLGWRGCIPVIAFCVLFLVTVIIPVILYAS